MTNNFELIKNFIQTQWEGKFNENTDAFYTVEIIGRRKDGATIESHKFKTYFIKDIEDLDKYENEIKTICDILKMRAYISINSKSFKQVTLNTLCVYAERVAQNNYNNPYSIFDSCTGKFVDRSNQLWIIDVDKEEADEYGCNIDNLESFLFKYIIENKCEPYKKIVTIIPTKSGEHIICHPFNVEKFQYYLSDFCNSVGYDVPHKWETLIKKNNNTLLYENIE